MRQRHGAGGFIRLEQTDQLYQILIQASECLRGQTVERIGQHTLKRARYIFQQIQRRSLQKKLHLAPVGRAFFNPDQLFELQTPDQITGGGLVHIHTPRQFAQANTRLIAHHTQRPNLRATQTDALFNMLEVTAHRAENHPKTAQHLRRWAGRNRR